MAIGWEGEVDLHEKILAAAKRERAEGETARQQAQQLLIQSALLLKQAERSRADRGGLNSWWSWGGFCLVSLGACVWFYATPDGGRRTNSSGSFS
jgi:hypothetical protein